MGVDLKFTTAGAPDHTYYSLLKFGDNNKLDATLRALSDGQGNDIGIKISNTQVSIDSTLIMGSLTASKLVYLNASKELVTIADGTVGQALVTNGAGVYSFATIAGGGGITINTSVITGGTNGRLLYDNAGTVGELDTATYPSLTELSYVKGVTSAIQTQLNAKLTTITVGTTTFTSGTTGRIIFDNGGVVGESAGLTYASGLFTVLGTTQQAKFAYDASNHLGITIDSGGGATILATGASKRLLISHAAVATANYGATSLGDGVWDGASANKFIGSTSGTILAVHPSASFTGDIIDFQGYNALSWFKINVNNQLDIRASTDLQMSLGRASGAGLNFTLATGANALAKITGDYFTSEGNIYIGTYSHASDSANLTIDRNGRHGFNVAAPACLIHGISTTEQLRLGYNTSNYASFTTGATGSLTIALTGTSPRTTFSQGVTMGGTLRLTPYTVATLPSGVVGDTAYVTDATAPTYLGALTGGGAVTCPVFYNGAAWVSA